MTNAPREEAQPAKTLASSTKRKNGNNESNMSMSPLRLVSDSTGTYVHSLVHSSREFRPSALRGTLQRTPRLMDGLLLALRVVLVFVRWSKVTRSFTAAKAFAAVTLAR